MTLEESIDAQSLARRAVDIADAKQATDITMLDLRSLSTIADYFVICTGDNERQLRAILKEIDDQLAKEGSPQARIEGTPETGWILLDYGDVIIHIFSADQRAFYRLDKLWQKATPVVVVQ
jgi:ribosome-associated protein